MQRNSDIKEYLHGNQRGWSANRLEREALSDPFLFEALEGLTTTPGDPIDGLIRLERQLNERARSSRKGKDWFYVAASVAIFAISGALWFTLLHEKEVLINSGLAQFPSLEITPGKSEATSILANGAGVPLSGRTDSTKGVGAGELQKQTQLQVLDDASVMEVAEGKESFLAGTSVDTVLVGTRRARMAVHVVEGIVVDTVGTPLPGVTVMLEGTNVGTVTDAKGYFRINLPALKGHLSFHFVGMKSQRYGATAGSKLQVKMYDIQSKPGVMSATVSMKDMVAAVVDVDNFNRYLGVALKYPEEDVKSNNQGVIQLSFEFNKKMTPSRIKILNGFSKESNQEIIRLLAEGPVWEKSSPGKRIYASVRFVIGKDGRKNTAVLTIEKNQDE